VHIVKHTTQTRPGDGDVDKDQAGSAVIYN